MHFVLIAPIHLSQDPKETIPEGATGRINQPENEYLLLIFDQPYTKQLQYWDNILVVDLLDPDPDIFSAIRTFVDVGVKPCHQSTRSIQELVT